MTTPTSSIELFDEMMENAGISLTVVPVHLIYPKDDGLERRGMLYEIKPKFTLVDEIKARLGDTVKFNTMRVTSEKILVCDQKDLFVALYCYAMREDTSFEVYLTNEESD